MDAFYVYVHSRPSTGEPFYVGKGTGKRARKRDGRTLHWKNLVEKEGGFHVSFLAKNVCEEFAFLVEVESIDLFRRRACQLINATDGGEGASGRQYPEHARIRLSQERKGRPLSPGARAAALAFHLGRKQPKETTDKRAAANRGKRRSPEQRKAMSERQIGTKRSAEARANMSAARKAWLARNNKETS